MSTLKDSLKSQRQTYESEIETTENSLNKAKTSTTIISPELITLDMQMQASQARLEDMLSQKDAELRYSKSRDAFTLSTPYGKIISYCTEYEDSYYQSLVSSMPESDKIGRKYLKEHNIKSKDYVLAREITEYFTNQSISAYIEQNKDDMSANEYQQCHQSAYKDLQESIKILNKKGFIVNPKTGDLEYKNPALQKAWDLAQKR